jgi:hypothetical protein
MRRNAPHLLSRTQGRTRLNQRTHLWPVIGSRVQDHDVSRRLVATHLDEVDAIVDRYGGPCFECGPIPTRARGNIAPTNNRAGRTRKNHGEAKQREEKWSM